MGASDRIAIKYLNVSTSDTYIVDDLTISEDGNSIQFSWLVSCNATENPGSLIFLINFRCINDAGRITYNWSTQPCSTFSILEGVYSMDSNPQDLYDFWAKYENKINILTQATMFVFCSVARMMFGFCCRLEKRIHLTQTRMLTLPPSSEQSANLSTIAELRIPTWSCFSALFFLLRAILIPMRNELRTTTQLITAENSGVFL